MFLLLFAIIFAFIYFFMIFPTQWLKVERVEYDLGIHKKIIQISDIHIKNLRVDPKRILKIIKRENPDYLFLTGDIVDRHEEELKSVEEFLKIISQSQVEMYAVLGNHDRYLPDIRKLENLLEKYQVKLLKNEWVEEDGFYLIGIDDSTHGHQNFDSSFSFPINEKKRIVMTHNPEIILNKKMPAFDYLMAGHLHGKQINIPFLYRIKKMGKLASSGIYKGKHSTKKGTVYISKGVGQTRINIRLFVRSEMTIHYL